MGNAATATHQQSTSPQLAQSKTFTSPLADLPETTNIDQKRVLFGSYMEKSLPKKIFDNRSTGKNKDDGEKPVKSNSSKESCTFEDSSSIVFIDRKGKSCKLKAPSQSPGLTYYIREKGLDISEYSPNRQQRNQVNGKPVVGDFLLITKDDRGQVEWYGQSKNDDLFIFGESANYSKYPNYLDCHGIGRISTGTTFSEISGIGRPFEISFSHSDAHRPSDSVTISWPQEGNSEESVKILSCLTCGTHLSCLSCGAYALERGSQKPEYKQQTKRVDYTAKYLSNPTYLDVVPRGKQASPSKSKDLSQKVSSNPQAPLFLKVVNAD